MTPCKFSPRRKRLCRLLWGPLVVVVAQALTCGRAHAADYFAWLNVRYPNRAVKTFLQGPYPSKARCDLHNQTTWDNVITSCGSCAAEVQQCGRMEDLPEMYRKVLRQEPAAFPYVVATRQGRIFMSGVSAAFALEECQRMEAAFKRELYAEARCIRP
jgi:hypothetical protein